MSASTLKHLNSQLSYLEEEEKLADSKLRKYKENLRSVQKHIQEVRSEIARLSTKIIVSEHALLRFAERVMGFDPAEVEKVILTEKFKSLVKNFNGKGKFPIGNGLVAVVENNVVKTIHSEKKR